MNISGLSSSRPDFAQMREAMFNKADTDKNGGINKAEFTETMKNSPFSQAEGAPDIDTAFGEIDGDGDGELSKTEMKDATKAFEQKFSDMISGGGKMGADTIDTLLKALDEADKPSSSSESTQSRKDYVQKLVAQLQDNGQAASLFTMQA